MFGTNTVPVVALGIIGLAWIAAAVSAFLPMFVDGKLKAATVANVIAALVVPVGVVVVLMSWDPRASWFARILLVSCGIIMALVLLNFAAHHPDRFDRFKHEALVKLKIN